MSCVAQNESHHGTGSFLPMKLMRSPRYADFHLGSLQHFYIPPLRFFSSTTLHLPFGRPLRTKLESVSPAQAKLGKYLPKVAPNPHNPKGEHQPQPKMKAGGQYKKSCTNYQGKETNEKWERNLKSKRFRMVQENGKLWRNYFLYAGEFWSYSYWVLAQIWTREQLF